MPRASTTRDEGRSRSGPLRTLVEWLDPDVLVVHRAFRIMRLEGDSPGARDFTAGPFSPAVPIRRLRPIHDLLVVHLDRDGIAFDDDVFREPLVIFRRHLVVVDDMVEAPGPDVIGVRVVHLNFEPG